MGKHLRRKEIGRRKKSQKKVEEKDEVMKKEKNGWNEEGRGKECQSMVINFQQLAKD